MQDFCLAPPFSSVLENLVNAKLAKNVIGASFDSFEGNENTMILVLK